MSWKNCIKIINNLYDNIDNYEIANLYWQELVNETNNVNHEKPYHISKILELIQNNIKLSILDHGCGSGKTVVYLISLGFINSKGIDVYTNSEKFNNFFIKKFNLKSPVFYNYDGLHLPFENESFDFIFSQQVLEHVETKFIDNYFKEEKRTLKNNSKVYHQIPHLLVPYESHVKIWFAHWLPKSLQNFVYRFFKIDIDYFHSNIFLRTPRFFLNKLDFFIGKTIIISKDRFKSKKKMAYYDGSIVIRNIIQKLFLLPIIGNILLNILIRFTMLETLSIKNIKNAK